MKTDCVAIFCKFLDDNDITYKRIKVCFILTEALQECYSGIETNTAKLMKLNPQNPNIEQTRGIMMATARVMDKLSNVQENNTPLLKQHFFSIVDNAIKMRSVSTPNTEEDTLTRFIYTLFIIYPIQELVHH